MWGLVGALVGFSQVHQHTPAMIPHLGVSSKVSSRSRHRNLWGSSVGRGCTPEFSRAKAKKRRFGSTYATKNGRAGRATSHFYPSDKSPIFYKTASEEIDPCDIIIAPLLGGARDSGDAVAGGYHLRVPLRSQNRNFFTPRGEKSVAGRTDTPRRR